MSEGLQARRQALRMILHPLEVAAVAAAVAAPLVPWTEISLLAAAGLGLAGAGLRRHWPSMACWAATGIWIGAGAPLPSGFF